VRRVGLDVGSVRVGVALSDRDGTIASPHAVWDSASLRADPRVLVRLVEDYEVGEVVVGLPVGLSGQEGPQARWTRSFVEGLRDTLDVPVVLHDERLTSVEAERVMADSGVDARGRRGSVDKVAAAIMLQSYLDARSLRDARDATEGSA
jgi:putative Holliday junction resolvase